MMFAHANIQIQILSPFPHLQPTPLLHSTQTHTPAEAYISTSILPALTPTPCPTRTATPTNTSNRTSTLIPLPNPHCLHLHFTLLNQYPTHLSIHPHPLRSTHIYHQPYHFPTPTPTFLFPSSHPHSHLHPSLPTPILYLPPTSSPTSIFPPPHPPSPPRIHPIPTPTPTHPPHPYFKPTIPRPPPAPTPRPICQEPPPPLPQRHQSGKAGDAEETGAGLVTMPLHSLKIGNRYFGN